MQEYKTNIKYLYILCGFIAPFILFQYYYNHLIAGTIYDIFLGTIILIIFFITLIKPKAGFFLFVFLIPLLNSLPKILNSSEINVLLFLFFPLWLGFWVKHSSDYLKNSQGLFEFDSDLNRPILLMIGLISISGLISILRYANFYPFITSRYYNLVVNYNGYTANQSIHWVIYFFFNLLSGLLFLYLTYNLIKKKEDILTSLVLLVSSTVLSSSVLFYQYFVNPMFGNFAHWAQSGRLNATFSDPNSMGNFTVLLFPVFLILPFYLKKVYQKILAGLGLIILLIMIFLSGSRSAFVGVILSTIILLSLNFKTSASWIKRKKGLALSAIIIAVIMFLTVVGLLFIRVPGLSSLGVVGKLSESIAAFLNYWQKDGFIEAVKSISNYRYIYWQQATWMLKDYPLSGIGLGTYITELPHYIIKTGANFFIVDFAGNYYLQVLAELGITGFIPMIFIFYLTLSKGFFAIRKEKRYKLIMSALITSLISMLIVFNLGPHTNIVEIQFSFWLVIALIFAFTKLVKGKESNLSRPIDINTIVAGIAYAVILIIFALNLLVASCGELSLNKQQIAYGWKNNFGFYQEIEEEGEKNRWISVDASEVVEKEGNALIIPLKAENPDIGKNPLKVSFYINNSLTESIKVQDKNWKEVKLNLMHIEEEEFTLTITCSRSWVPKEWGVNDSTKELGVLVGTYRFVNNF